MRALSLAASLVLLAAPVLAQDAPKAHAELKDAAGKPAGTVVLTQMPHGILVHVEASGLAPGWHGMHIHAVGKCEGPAFASAGGHFNPTGHKHGMGAEGQHAGDLPGIFAHADGTAAAEAFLEGVTFEAGAGSLFGPDGTAIVVHAKADDYKTDPSGNSGDRVACGVVTKG